MHSFIKVINEFITMERKISLRENWLIFWGIWEKAELFLGFWKQRLTVCVGSSKLSLLAYNVCDTCQNIIFVCLFGTSITIL